MEHDLLPMAAAHGLGVTPWSPLKGGLLSGKYGRHQTPRGEGRHVPGVSRHLTEANYAIIDALESVALEAGTGVAQVALAWVLARSGVASPILGVRTLGQFDANLAALEVHLTEDQVARLDAASAPPAVFPHGFLQNARHVMQSGATINGFRSEPWPMAPRTEAERW